MSDKNEINARVQARYDELMGAGVHGHYENMFCVVHEERLSAALPLTLRGDKLTAELEALRADAARLRDFVEYYARCPCCEKIDECMPGCTFSEDARNDHESMMMAREALEARKGAA